jgi:hypothetical protein
LTIENPLAIGLSGVSRNSRARSTTGFAGVEASTKIILKKVIHRGLEGFTSEVSSFTSLITVTDDLTD